MISETFPKNGNYKINCPDSRIEILIRGEIKEVEIK